MANKRTPIDDIIDAAATVSKPEFWSVVLTGKQAERVRRRARERGITELEAFRDLLMQNYQEEK
jgi:hypothetical protein